MTPKEIESLIIAHSEGATDNVADGVRYKELAQLLSDIINNLNKEYYDRL
jgi:hypothetical protein